MNYISSYYDLKDEFEINVNPGYNRYFFERQISYNKHYIFMILNSSSDSFLLQIDSNVALIPDYMTNPFKEISSEAKRRFMFRPFFNCKINKNVSISKKFYSAGNQAIFVTLDTLVVKHYFIIKGSFLLLF